MRYPLILALVLIAGCGSQQNPAQKDATANELRTAAVTCNFDRLEQIVNGKPELVDQDIYGQTLVKAAESSRRCGSGSFRFLIERAPAVNVRWLNLALVAAIQNRTTETVSIALQHGADPNGSDSSGRTLLADSLLSFDPTIPSLLVNAGARQDVFSAAALGDHTLLRALLRQDPAAANATGPYPDGSLTPIELAMRFHQKESARIILKYVPSAALKEYIAASDESRVRDYLDHHPISVNLPDDLGGTPLLWAVQADDVPVAKLLIERGAAVNGVGQDRKPLQTAIRSGNMEMVKFLVERGADVTDRPGQVPLTQIAIAAKHPEIAATLAQANRRR